MRLVHFSGEPVAAPRSTDRATQPDPNERDLHFKPRGLWVSDEDTDAEIGWLEWSKGESFRLDSFKHAYEVTLTDEPGAILYLRSVGDIDQFTQTYGIIPEWRRKLDAVMPLYDDGRQRYDYCDWPRVASLFKGIVITPYQWERRLHSEAAWYYTWDCASGCIWDATAITGWREIDPPDLSEALAEKAKRDAEREQMMKDNGWETEIDMMRGITQQMREATEKMKAERDDA